MNNSIPPFSLEKLGISSLNEMQQQMIESSKTNSGIILHAPTGSGKTRVVEAASEVLFNEPHTVVKIDCAFSAIDVLLF